MRIQFCLFICFFSAFFMVHADGAEQKTLLQKEIEDQVDFLNWFSENINDIGYREQSRYEKLYSTYFSRNTDKLRSKVKIFSNSRFPLAKLGFGVLLLNKKHQIYRSKALGVSGIFNLFNHLSKLGVPLPKRVIFMNKDGYQSKATAFLSLFSDRFNNFDDFALQEAKTFKQLGIEFFHPLNSDVFLTGKDPTKITLEGDYNYWLSPKSFQYFADLIIERNLSQFVSTKNNYFNILELILNAKGPVLFHCTGGIHRTGMIAMGIRYMQEGLWTLPYPVPLKVVANAKSVVEINNNAQLEYYLHNKHFYREENVIAVEELARESRFLQLKNKYQSSLNELADYFE